MAVFGDKMEASMAVNMGDGGERERERERCK